MAAKVTVYPNEAVRTLLLSLDSNIAKLLIVSKFKVSEEEVPDHAMKFDDVAILVEHADADVCVRCRRFDKTVGANENMHLHEVCDHCAEILKMYFSEAVKEGFEK